MMKKLLGVEIVCLATLLALVAPLGAEPQGADPLALLIIAHNAMGFRPASIEIRGTSVRVTVGGTVNSPVRILATRQEETLTEYGQIKQVATPTAHFKDDGQKSTLLPTPAGFAQLDMTSVFLLTQLQTSGFRPELPQPAVFRGAPAQKVRGTTGRKQVHYLQYTVEDKPELYVSGSGLLAGVIRTFYSENPSFKATREVTFYDYRATQGVLLPYRIERRINGELVEVVTVDQYAVDVPVPPSTFNPRRPQ